MIEDINRTDKLIFDLRLRQIDFNEQKKNTLRREISEKYNVPLKNVEVNFVPITVDENGDDISLASDIINNIQDPRFQQQLLGEFLKLNEITDINLEDIIAIDERVNAFIDFDSYSKYKSYKFKYVKWKNYLSYGDDNYFDFTNLHGLVLLNGQPENQCGKTTFAIDLLRFALFGKAQKSPTLDSVFNIYLPQATEVVVEAGLEISGVDYVIRRTVTRPALSKRTKKSKAKQKLEYFKVIDGNLEEIDNCEGENNAETNNIIRESIGSVEDFNLVISATAYTLGDLLRMGQTDKGRLFSKWLGLLSIEKKEEIAKDIWKKNENPKLLSNKYNKADIEAEVGVLKVNIVECEREIGEENKKLEETDKRIAEQEKERADVYSKRREIKEELKGLDVQTVENSIEMKSNELEIKRGQMTRHKESYAEVKDATFDEEAYNELSKTKEVKQKEQNELRISNAELKANITALRNENARIEGLIKAEKCPTCGQHINTKEQTDVINENEKKIQELINLGVENKKKIDQLEKECGEITEKMALMDEERKKLQLKKELELKMIALKSNIDALKLQIKDLNSQKELIETNKENIRYNNEIEGKLRVVEANIKTENGTRDTILRTIEKAKSVIQHYENEIAKREEIVKTLSEEEKIIRNWAIYQEMVGKNGIIKIVLRRALPILNNEIARLLNGLCDFNVEISVSDDNKVCMDLLRNGQRLDLGTCASGFETVMASVAVRHALSCIATLAKPNFTVYDEILDGVAVSNYENVKELFNRMTQSYDFIIHITHNELISDWHNDVITVTKDKEGISVIEMSKIK